MCIVWIGEKINIHIKHYTTMEKKLFNDIKELSNNDSEGIVLLGAGGNLTEWVNGITKMLNDENIVIGNVSQLWENIFQLTTSGGRTDLVMIMNPNIKFNIGKLAMWRLAFGNCSWVSDYVVNYADQH